MACSLYTIISETRKIAELEEENFNLQAARRNRGIYEVLTDYKDYFKEIADARLKLDKDTVFFFAVHCEGRQSRETSDLWGNFN